MADYQDEGQQDYRKVQERGRQQSVRRAPRRPPPKLPAPPSRPPAYGQPDQFNRTYRPAPQYVRPPSLTETRAFAAERLDAIHPSVPQVLGIGPTMHVAAAPVSTDALPRFSARIGGFAPMVNVDNSPQKVAVLRERFRHLPQAVKDALLAFDNFKTVDELLAHYATLPSGQGAALLGQLVVLPAYVKQRAQGTEGTKAEQAQARAIMYGLFHVLPPTQEGQGGYIYHFRKPGVFGLGALADPVSILMNNQIGGLEDLVAGTAALPFQYAAHAIHQATGISEAGLLFGQDPWGGGKVPSVTEAWKRNVYAGTDEFGQSLAGLGGQLGRVVASSSGLNPDDPENSTAVAIYGVMADFYLTGAAGGALRGIKLGRQTISAYKDYLLLADEAKAAGAADAAKAYRVAANEVLKTTSPHLSTRLGFMLTAKTPEDLFATRKGLQLADQITAKVRMGATASDLARAYRNLPAQVAETLTRARGPEDVRSILVSAARGETREGVAAIESRIADIDVRLASHEAASQMATAGQLFGDGGVGTTEGMLSIIGKSALIDERRFQVAKLRNAITPTFAPIERLPSSGPLFRAMADVTDTKLGAVVSNILHGHIPLPWIQRVQTGDVELAMEASYRADAQVNLLRSQVQAAQEAGDAQKTYALAQQLVDAEDHAQKLTNVAIRLQGDAGKLKVRLLRTSPSISRFWEEAHNQRLWDVSQSDPRIPADALEENIRNVDRMLTRVGATKATKRRIEEMFVRLPDAPDRQAAFAATRLAITRALEDAPLVDRRAAQMLAQWDTANEMERRRGLVAVTQADGSVNYEPTIYHNGRSDNGARMKLHLASDPDEMRLWYDLPSYGAVVEATGYWRRILRSMEGSTGLVEKAGGAVSKSLVKRGRYGLAQSTFRATQHVAPLRALAKSWRFSAKALDASTQTWKNLIILGRSMVHIPGTPIGQFQLRVVGEENLRAAAYGQVSFFSHPAEWFRYVKKYGDLEEFLGSDFERIVGHVSREIGDQVRKGSSAIVLSNHPDFNAALSQRFSVGNKKALWRFFAGQDLIPASERAVPDTVDAAVAWLNGSSAEAVAYREVSAASRASFRRALTEELGREVTPEEALRRFVERKYLEFGQVTAGHEGALTAIRTGKAKAAAMTAEQRQEISHIAIDRASIQHRLRIEAAREAPDWNEVDRLKLAEGVLDGQEADVLARDVTSVEVGTDEFAGVLADWRASGEYRAPPAVAGDPELSKISGQRYQRVTNWMYRKWVTKPDVKFARGPVFGQMYEREVARLESFGWSSEAAANRAKVWAGARTREMMYDLATRTSSQRFFRNLFPFGAAWQEIGETWAWKIPAQMYPGLGHIYLAKRVQELGALFSTLGVDLNSKQFIPLKGVVQAFLGLSGTGIVPELGFYPQSANLVTNTIGPGLGPLPNVVLSQLVQHHAPGAEAVSAALQPFGTDIQLGPANLNRLFEATFHRPAPWEVASPDVQQQLWDASVWDATQEGAVKFKDTRPKTGDYPNTTQGQQAYDQAMTRWTATVHDWAESQAGKFALIRFVASSFSPVNFTVTDTWQRDVTKLNTSLGPLYRRDPSDPRIDSAWVNFYRTHPGAELYGHAPQLVNHRDLSGAQQKDATAYYTWLKDQAAKGNVQQLTPDQAVKYGLYLSSEHWHQYRLKLIMTEAGGGIGITPAQQAANILNDYGAYKDRIGAENDRWSEYKAFNFTAANTRETYLKTLSGGDFPNRTLDQQRIADLLKLTGETQVALEEGGMKPSDIAKMKAQVVAAGDALGLKYGAPTDPVAVGMQWWFDKVYAPHFAELATLYDQIDKTPSGLRSPLFEQIRKLANQDMPVVRGGVTFPSVQQFQWNEKSAEEQTGLKLKWITRPTEWLTTFQQGKLGLSEGRSTGKFFDLVNSTFDEMKRNLADMTGTGSEARKADYKKSILAYLADAADSAGLKSAWEFSQMLPYQRILKAGLFAADRTFAQIGSAVDTVRQIVTDAGFVPGGGSQLDLYYRKWLFGAIDDYRAGHPNSPLDKDLKALEEATAPAGQAMRPGPDMYMAVFYDNWYGDHSGYGTVAQAVSTSGQTETVQQFMQQYRNGYVPSGALVNVDGALVSQTIAQNVQALVQAAIADGVLKPGQLIGNGYRSYGAQVGAYQAHQSGQHPAPVARPGTSLHGWGLAIDFDTGNGALINWLRSNGSRFGLYNLPGEPWHYSVNGH